MPTTCCLNCRFWRLSLEAAILRLHEKAVEVRTKQEQSHRRTDA
jgi:hypothetical protein